MILVMTWIVGVSFFRLFSVMFFFGIRKSKKKTLFLFFGGHLEAWRFPELLDGIFEGSSWKMLSGKIYWWNWTWVWMEMWWTDCQIFMTSQVCNHVVCLSEIEPCILFKGSQMACFGHIFGCIHNCNGLDILTLLSNLSDFFQDQNGFLEHRELLKHLYPREYVKSVGRGGSMSTWHPESWESLFFFLGRIWLAKLISPQIFLGSEKQGTCCWYSQIWVGVINSAKMVQWSKKSEGMGPPNWDDSGQDILPSERGNLRDFQQTLLQPSIVGYGYTWFFGLKFTHGVSKDPNLPSGGENPLKIGYVRPQKGNSSEPTHQFSGANCC